MNNILVWGKVLLSIYRQIPKIQINLDKCSMNTAMSQDNCCDIEKRFKKMISLKNQKINCSNAYILVNENFIKLKSNYKKVLIERFFKRTPFNNIDLDGASIRTVYRAYNTAIEKFAEILIKAGYDGRWFNQMFGDDLYFTKLYFKVLDEDLVNVNRGTALKKVTAFNS